MYAFGVICRFCGYAYSPFFLNLLMVAEQKAALSSMALNRVEIGIVSAAFMELRVSCFA